MESINLRLLIVDDEDSVRTPLAERLKKSYNYLVDTAPDGITALQLIENAHGRYDVTLIDQVLEGEIDGLELLEEIKIQYPEIQSIIITGWGTEAAGINALRLGAYRYFAKPFNLEELALTIRFAAEQKQLSRERDYLSALVKVSHKLTQTTDLNKQLRQVWNFVHEKLDTATFFVALYEAEEDTLKFRLSYDKGELDPISERNLGDDPAQWGLAGYVVKKKQELVWFDSEQLIRNLQSEGVTPLVSGYGPCETGICLPFQVGKEILGVLSVQSHYGQAFDQAFLNAVRTLGSYLAPAIENTRLFSNLEYTRKHLEGLVASSLDAVISINQDKIITVFNKQAEALLGYTADELIGHSVKRLYFNVDAAREIWDLVNKQGKIVSHEIKLKHREGTVIPVTLSAVAIKDTKGNIIGQAGFLRDLRKVRLLEERQRSLIRASQAINKLDKVDQMLQLIVESAITSFPNAEKGSLHLYDGITRKLSIKASYGFDLQIVHELTLLPGEGFAGWVYEQGSPIVCGNVQEDERFKILPDQKDLGPKSVICVPLKMKTNVFGALSLDNLTHFNAFTSDDIDLLSSFADFAAIAIENARLFQETKDGLDRLSSVYEASSQITSTLNPDQALKFIVENACKTIGAWRASVLLVDDVGHPQRLIAVGFTRNMEADTSIRPNGISQQVIGDGIPVFINDTEAKKQLVHPKMIADGVKAAACLPFAFHIKKLGVIWFHYLEPRNFSEAEKKTLRLYANQAAIAYDNARKMQELEHMQKAAEAMANTLEPAQVLQQIVESACSVLQADSSAVWSYDNSRNQFIPEELRFYGIPADLLEKFRKTEPKKGGTADTVMNRGMLGITDLSDPSHDFMGASTLDMLNVIGVKSYQGAPLQVGDEKLGVLYVNYNRSRSFTRADESTLESFAYHAALALKKARLLEQLGKARDTARVVAQFTVLGDPNATLQSVARGTMEAVDCDAVTLYVYDKNKGRVNHPPIMIGVNQPEDATRYGEVLLDSVVYEMLWKDKPYFVPSIADDDLFVDRPFTIREGIVSCVAIPLSASGQKVGVMFVNYRIQHRFTADELTNIELFSNQAAVAIRNAQLYQLELKYSQTLQAIQVTSRAASAVLEPNILLPMITEKAAEIFNSPAISLMLWDKNKENLVIEAGFGLSIEYQQGLHIPRSKVDDISKMGIHAYVFDINKNPIGDSDLVHREGLHTVLVAPLMIGEELIGILNIYSKTEPCSFDDREKELAQIFANHAAIAIHNARAYDELKQTQGLVGAQTALAWMGMANAAWRHTIEGYAVNIGAVITLMRKDIEKYSLGKERQQKLENRLNIMKGEVEKILEKPITPPLSSENIAETILLNDLIKERLSQLWENEDYQNITLVKNLSESNPTVKVSPEWFQRVIDILIENAAEAMDKSPTQELTIETQLAENQVKILFSDTGGGMPVEIREKVFLKRIEKPEGSKGFGIGLLMVQAIMQAHKGGCRLVESRPDGTTFELSLPIE